MSDACAALHSALTALPRLRAGYANDKIPRDGIYVLFQTGETAHGVDRIVRVGTHTGQGNLGKRLSEHLYVANKDRSIFRKHIGRCLLAKRNDPLVAQWELDLTSKTNRGRYSGVVDNVWIGSMEEEVSKFIIENFTLSVFSVAERKDRLGFEGDLLATFASCNDCQASENWLGRYHPNKGIIPTYGLWNVQGLHGMPMSVDDVSRFTAAYLSSSRF